MNSRVIALSLLFAALIVAVQMQEDEGPIKVLFLRPYTQRLPSYLRPRRVPKEVYNPTPCRWKLCASFSDK
uniref:Liver-expressed antimicrobial peptide 2 n=1 Tax=Panagrellus redivivus TaxID=6233 RepID=A0A7E4W266_PANRE